ncbi:MAG: hypothetical protein E7388_01140 [Ruminococcaceae bacterium]|nr:hypothetical protein [Oscillospiraceae bacterium]
MEIYIAVNCDNSDSLKKRLEFEEVFSEYKVNADEFIILLKEKGYEVYRNGLFKILNPNDEKIVIYCNEDTGKELLSILFYMPLEQVKSQFKLKSGTLTKFWIQNYMEGYSAARLMFLNDNTHNYQEV